MGKGLATLAFALFSVFQYFLLAAYISQVRYDYDRQTSKQGKDI